MRTALAAADATVVSKVFCDALKAQLAKATKVQTRCSLRNFEERFPMLRTQCRTSCPSSPCFLLAERFVDVRHFFLSCASGLVPTNAVVWIRFYIKLAVCVRAPLYCSGR